MHRVCKFNRRQAWRAFGGPNFDWQKTQVTGIKLDVTESTVIFTPKGGVQSVAVGPESRAGHVSAAGRGQRPEQSVPSAAKSIIATNAESIQVTDDVLLSVLSEAMGDALMIEDKGLREDDGSASDSEEEAEPTDQDERNSKDKPTDEKVSSDESTADEDSCGNPRRRSTQCGYGPSS